jgi:GT2 family glycosyltransferase
MSLTGISIVVPHHEGGRYTAACLHSISAAIAGLSPADQLCVEVIAVDDRENLGAGHARNEGAEQSHFSHLLFVDADVVLDPTFLAVAFEVLRARPGARIIQGPHSHLPANSEPSLFQSYLALSFRYRAIRSTTGNYTTFVLSGCVLFERAYFDEVGRFPTKYRGSGGEEFELMRHVSQDAIVYEPRLISRHHWETLGRRLAKVFRRGRNYEETVLRNEGFSLESKLEMACLAGAASAMSLSLLLIPFFPRFASGVYLAAAFGYAAASWGLVRYCRKNHSSRIALLSILFGQLEYTVAAVSVALTAARNHVGIPRAQVPLR